MGDFNSFYYGGFDFNKFLNDMTAKYDKLYFDNGSVIETIPVKQEDIISDKEKLFALKKDIDNTLDTGNKQEFEKLSKEYTKLLMKIKEFDI